MYRSLAVALALLAALAMVAPPVFAQDEVTTYDDWGYKCDPAPEGGQLCYVFQNVTQKETGELVLGARIAYRDGQPDPLMVATVPLGSLIPPGAALVIDGVDPVKLPFFLCAAQGCTTVATALPPAMVDALKRGVQASIRVAAPNKQVVGLPLSLKGFTKAINSLKP